MNAVEIIAKKRDGVKLSRAEIAFFINSYLKNDIKDYQMAALLMATYLKGMDFEETGWLTDVMLNTGDIVKFPKPDRIYVDKHSTGGVGDKVSLILAPWVAACGVKVPMLSGRGLGHTGGTLDKLESIPGYRTNLSLDEFKKGVEKIGCIISGQTPEIAPADKAMYALRDVTSTVESIPLICGSILSKKFAAGPSGLVFDVKCGNGAFMKDIKSADQLARNLIGVCKAMGKNVKALITDMNQPLGRTAGNLLEVVETVEILNGDYQDDIFNVTLDLAVEMLIMSEVETNREKAIQLLKKKFADGSAFEKFEEMVYYQGGDLAIFKNKSKTPHAAIVKDIKAIKSGYIIGFDTMGIGRLIVDMGGGRKTKDDKIDPLVGIEFPLKIGDKVNVGDVIARLHARDENQFETAAARLNEYISITDTKINPPELIKRTIA